jgi:hypothetical protein
MEKPYKNERIKDLKEISKRHASREIEGCTSWRHFAVHEDRGWLLNALGKIQKQVEKVSQAAGNADDRQAQDAEVQKLLAIFEAEKLNHLGDADK